MDKVEEDQEPQPATQTNREAPCPTAETETPKRTKRGLEDYFVIPTRVPSINTVGSAGLQPTPVHPDPSALSHHHSIGRTDISSDRSASSYASSYFNNAAQHQTAPIRILPRP